MSKERKILIAGNWKMHKTNEEAVDLVNQIKKEVAQIQEVDIVVCPPFTALSDVKKIISDTNIKLGAQNMYFESEGAFTGEISPKMLKSIGCEFVIIGHSERRKYFKEDDSLINKKLKSALEWDLTPIFCVGETLEERENNLTLQVLERQLREGLKDFTKNQVLKIIIAYEPVWAIGTGKTATPLQAQSAQSFIREFLNKNFEGAGKFVRILYGGSIKPENIRDLVSQKDVDGGLVGGASLKSDSFVKIIKNSII